VVVVGGPCVFRGLRTLFGAQFLVRPLPVLFYFINLAQKWRHHRRFAFHYGHPPGRQGEDEIGVEALTGHGVISGAAGMVDGQHYFRDGRGGHRFDEARARANYALLFGLDADHETGNVLNKERRRSVAVAGFDEIGRPFGALGVNDSADPGRFTRGAWDEAAVVGDDANAHAAHAPVADDHLFRVIGLEFVEALPIQNAI